jgi:hypothetical protein
MACRDRRPDPGFRRGRLYADAILDRLVHNAYRIDLSGDSLRRRRSVALARAANQAIDKPPYSVT